MNADNPSCYETAETNLFTRFVTCGPEGTYALPYSALMFVHLPPVPAGDLEVLTLGYVTHVVTIHGTQLSQLLLIVAKGRAETIRIGGGQSGGTLTSTVREITIADPN